jgi:hypothetical protein
MRSQLERLFSLVYRREMRCRDSLEKVKKGNDGKARISPKEAAEEIFRNEVPEDQLLCFLLLVSLGNNLVLEVIDDLGKRRDGALSVDEALLAINEVLDELCEYSKKQTIRLVESSIQKNKARLTT